MFYNFPWFSWPTKMSTFSNENHVTRGFTSDAINEFAFRLYGSWRWLPDWLGKQIFWSFSSIYVYFSDIYVFLNYDLRNWSVFIVFYLIFTCLNLIFCKQVWKLFVSIWGTLSIWTDDVTNLRKRSKRKQRWRTNLRHGRTWGPLVLPLVYERFSTWISHWIL